MEKEEIKSLLQAAVERYGISHQIRMAIEEMAELIDALMKRTRARRTDADVITEIADVTIMMKQLMLIFGESAVRDEIDRKLNRLKERMDGRDEEAVL